MPTKFIIERIKAFLHKDRFPAARNAFLNELSFRAERKGDTEAALYIQAVGHKRVWLDRPITTGVYEKATLRPVP